MPIIGRISVGDGATFTPSVDNDGVISWSNNKNLENPASVDIPQAVIDRFQLAPIDSPAFSGTPTSPTPTAGDNSTKIATTEFVNNYLLLSGGTISGPISFSHSYITSIERSTTDTGLLISGGTSSSSGAYIELHGKDRSTEPSLFRIAASDGVTYNSLIGKIDGTLTWKGNNVITSAGGTMMGEITSSSEYPSAITTHTFKYTSTTRSNVPTSSQQGTLIKAVDKNNDLFSKIELFRYTSGVNELRLAAFDQNGDACIVRPRKGTSTNAFAPFSDNATSLGESGTRWKQLFAGTTTISTSDERLKDNIEAIPDEVLDAWGEVNWYQYQFKDSIAEKGENARIHTGAIAQRIESVFKSHGLDANRYGLLCYDEWEAEEEMEAGNRYSLRYEEALCMEASYQRRRADRLEERIARLEALMRTE